MRAIFSFVRTYSSPSTIYRQIKLVRMVNIGTYFFLNGFSDVSVFVGLAPHQIALLKDEVGRLVSGSEVAHKFTDLAKAVLQSHGVPNVVTLEEVADAAWGVRTDLACSVAHVGSHQEGLAKLQRWRHLARSVVLTYQLLERHLLKGVQGCLFLSLLLCLFFLCCLTGGRFRSGPVSSQDDSVFHGRGVWLAGIL